MRPTFSLIYTSVRPEQILPVIQDWVGKSRNPSDLEVILALDGKDTKSQAAVVDFKPNFKFKLVIQPDPPFNCVRGWNAAAAQATGKVLVQVTDDMLPPDAWDTKLKALEPATWMDEDWAVHVEDGYVHDIMVLAIITKVRYDRFGYFFYPDYPSLFCDTELTTVAYGESRVIEARHLLFEHRHPDCQKRERDDVDLVHASPERWTQGETLFRFRKQRNFPIDVGPNAVVQKESPPYVPPMKFCVYVQATKDDLCLFEVCKRMMEEGVNDFFFSIPDEYWSGRPTPAEDIAAVNKIAQDLRALGAMVECLLHRVKTYRFNGDTRLRVETRVRNDALAYIRKKGFEHVLIVDGDELWRRGLLGYVKEILRRWNPTSINCLMVPVVGCPGYPVSGATDVAVIYVNSSVPFKECRTPVGEQFRLQMPMVIHFTGTRRTWEETVRKHTDSGHFDDPDYDFKEFIENVLPHIAPGFSHTYPNGLKGIHFFKKYQIWPEIRDWMAEEVVELPKSLLPYLGGYDSAAQTIKPFSSKQANKRQTEQTANS